MARPAFFVFGIIIIPPSGDDIGHRQSAVAHHGRRQLAPRREGFYHHQIGHRCIQLRWSVVFLAHQIDPDRGAFVVRLDHIGRRHHVARTDIRLGANHTVHNRQARIAVNRLGAFLVHRHGRRQHTRMRIRQTHPFKHALHTAVFAPAPVQTIQHGTGFHPGKHSAEVGACIDLDNLISVFFPQSRSACAPCVKRHLALCGRATHHYCY